MAKRTTPYRCSACGHEEPKWLGRCPDCGEWNVLEEVKVDGGKPSTRRQAPAGERATATPLTSIRSAAADRSASGVPEFDRVLGGGLVPGASVLLGGEPGIGKSTLLLQAAAGIARDTTVLYASGEESPAQIRLRADRLGLATEGIHVLATSELDDVVRAMEKHKPGVVMVDSIQTIMSAEAGAVPGTVSQIRLCAHELISRIRETDAVIFLVAHVTKDGAIAGPKVLEHMVDTVLYFDRSGNDLRFVRPTKNRFGSIDEVGLFLMGQKGLVPVDNPGTLFSEKREGEMPAGISLAAVYEGSRILLVEIQALTVPAKGAMSRVYSDRIDAGRVSRVAAILEKHTALRFSDQDVYVNVAGGIRLSETGIELPLALALYSARTGLALSADTASAGELSLAGEIRPMGHLHRRVKAAMEFGCTRFLGPRAKEPAPYKGFVRVGDALRGVFPK